jgi:hypothetical protein
LSWGAGGERRGEEMHRMYCTRLEPGFELELARA